jgi:DNA-binding FadR family transcriptional regulator
MTTASTVLLSERRAWEVVLQSVELRLLSGELKPGDHLPPERQLAADLGVGRSSVREAIRVLEVLGLIRTATGSGPTAGAIIVATPSGGMSALMRLQVAAHGFAVADVVKTRLVLEAAVAAELASAHAAATVNPGQDGAERAAGTLADTLGPATQLLDAMDSIALTEAEFLALDAQFHVALAEASGNQVVAAMMAGLRNSIESYVLAAVPNLSSWAQTSARLRVEHRGILSAIQAGDQADATARVRAHITGYYAESRLTPDAPAPALSPSAKAEPGADANAETHAGTETDTTTRANRPRKEPTHG